MDPETNDQFGGYAQRPEIPAEFTQADALRLQSLSAGISAAKKQVDDGEITRDDGEVLMRGIHILREPLLQAQAAQQEILKQKAVNDVQENAAMGQGIAHSDALFRARGLPDRVVPYMHPMTGDTAFLYEQEPNKWAQVDFGMGKPEQPGVGPAETFSGGLGVKQEFNSNAPELGSWNRGGEGPPQQPPPPGGQPQTQMNAAPSGARGSEGGMATEWGAVPGQPGPSPDEGGQIGVSVNPTVGGGSPYSLTPNPQTGGHTLEIWNGPNRELAHFDRRGQIIGREQFDQDGNPVRQQAPQGQTLSPDQQNFLAEQTARQFEKYRPNRNSFPPGQQGDMHFGVAMQRFNHDVSRAIEGRVRAETQKLNQSQHMGEKVDETKRREQVAEQTRKDKEAATREKAETLKKKSDDYFKTYDHARKNLTTKDGKPPTHDEIEAEAEKIRQSHEKHLNPEAAKAQDAAAPVVGKALAAGDKEAASAGQELAQIVAKYRSIDKAPPEVQQRAKALLQKVQPYMGEVKPVGPAPPKTVGEIIDPKRPGKKPPGNPWGYGYGGPV